MAFFGGGDDIGVDVNDKKPSWPEYDPTYGYEPYWTLGEWVFKEFGDKSGKKTTQRPQVCFDECEPSYIKIGAVCVRRKILDYNVTVGCMHGTGTNFDKKYKKRFIGCYGLQHDNYSYAFITFNSYCDFLSTVCQTPGPTNLNPERYFLVHIGACIQPQGELYRLPYDDIDKHDLNYRMSPTLTPLPNFVLTRKDKFDERFRIMFKKATGKQKGIL